MACAVDQGKARIQDNSLGIAFASYMSRVLGADFFSSTGRCVREDRSDGLFSHTTCGYVDVVYSGHLSQ